jgi:ATP-dependent helicase HrpB
LPSEIIGADLAPLLIEVLKWGVVDPGELTWLDPPRTGQVKQARELLLQLGAIDQKGSLTDIGRQIGSLPLHPRLALMLIRGHERGSGILACRLAALMQNRDPFCDKNYERSVDIEDRLDILRLFEKRGAGPVRARGADPSICRRILREAEQYQRLLGVSGGVMRIQDAGNLLALAYPDRIAQKKSAIKLILASGRGVLLPVGDHLCKADFLVAAHVDGGKKQGRIFMAASLSLDEIIANHAHLLTREDSVVWHKSRVEAFSVLSLGSLEITREPLLKVSVDRIRYCLIEGIEKAGLACLGWQKKGLELKVRMESAHAWDTENWPDVSDGALGGDFNWLEPYLDNITTLKQLKKLDLHAILLAMLSWREQQELDRLFPTHFKVPSGSKIKLLYQPGEPPILAVRLQEMFGLKTTPTVFGGKVPIIVHLLSPAGRPIQITRDLTGFWQRTYGEVKKELKGRYPKHFWPDDPLTAQPTSRVRRKK